MISVDLRSSPVQGRYVATCVVNAHIYTAMGARAVSALARQLVIADIADDGLRVRFEGLADPIIYPSFQLLAFRPGKEIKPPEAA